MPELPEVETTRRGLRPFVVGQTIRSIAVREPRLRWPIEPSLDRRPARTRPSGTFPAGASTC